MQPEDDSDIRELEQELCKLLCEDGKANSQCLSFQSNSSKEKCFRCYFCRYSSSFFDCFVKMLTEKRSQKRALLCHKSQSLPQRNIQKRKTQQRGREYWQNRDGLHPTFIIHCVD